MKPPAPHTNAHFAIGALLPAVIAAHAPGYHKNSCVNRLLTERSWPVHRRCARRSLGPLRNLPRS
jgi:hypothetical protein